MLDLNALRDFVAVICEGSFSAAARALGVPKSTISKRVQDLEASLSTRLIERTTRSLRLTSDGAAFHARATRIVADAEDAEKALRAHGDEPVGHLRITSPQLFGQRYLGTVAAAYRTKFPKTTLEISLLDRSVDLIEENFDAAIRIGDLPDSTMVARTIAFADTVVVSTPSLLRRKTGLMSPVDLRTLPCLAFSMAPYHASWRLQKAGEVLEVQIKPALAINSLVALRDAAITGAGFAYLPRFIVADDVAAGRLALATPKWSGAIVPISLVYPSARFLSARLRGFVDILVETFPERRL